MISLDPVLREKHRMRVRLLLLRRLRNQTTRDRHLAVWHYILDTEEAAGITFKLAADESVRVHLGSINEVLALPKQGLGTHVGAYLNHAYGVLQIEPVGKFVYANLRDYALTHVEAEVPHDSGVGSVC